MSITAQTAPASATKRVESFLPATFLERGVAVPFTTPQLNGARARPGERRSLELIIPNLSGGRGVYIVAMSQITDFCPLTINDRRLADAVVNLRGVTPETIRHLAREVAGEGLAGLGAAAAAARAQQDDEVARLRTNFDLLINLVRQAEPKDEEPVQPEKARPLDLEYRGKRAVRRMAGRLRRPPDTIAAALEQLAEVFKGVGVRCSARVHRELETLKCVRQDVTKYSQNTPGTNASQAQVITASADLTIMLVTGALADARALADNIRMLLENWLGDPTPTMQILARPDWLLDGWNRICALWDAAPNREDTLAEMAVLVPVIPREADAWLSYRTDHMIDVPQYRSTVVRQFEDWRTGVTVADLISRNESLLERSL
jgi:hypothetical protein